MIDIEIATEASGWERSIPELEEVVGRAVDAAVVTAPDAPGAASLAVLLTDDAAIRELNAAWRHQDKPTNVLSFPMADERDLSLANVVEQELLLGDIVLARGVCMREAAEKEIAVDRHATHLLVHGTLHLLGCDHHDDREATDMEQREVRALARLGIPDPYGDRA